MRVRWAVAVACLCLGCEQERGEAPGDAGRDLGALDMASRALDASSDASDDASDASGGVDAGREVPPVVYVEATETHLPGPLAGLNMDAVAADIDADGDLDLVVAHEFRRTILLLNDGSGVFSDASARFPDTSRDSEDLAIADWDGDGALDVLVVSEDDRANELFLQRGDAFVDASDRLPTLGTSNAVAWAVLGGDASPSVFVGNAGQNRLWVQDPERRFVDATEGRLPALDDTTQDLELGDVDGDGDLDLVVGNEGDNVVLFQDGGVFTQAPDGCLPLREAPEETRDVELGDVDGDGDLDLVFGNVVAFVAGAEPANRLLLNDGSGCFVDATASRWQTRALSTFDADLVDLDGDGDLDLVTANLEPGLTLLADAFRAFLNDGTGHFTEATEALFGEPPVGKGFDVEAFDADGDGLLDLYFASRGAPDRLFLRRAR